MSGNGVVPAVHEGANRESPVKTIVITSIQSPTASVRALARRAGPSGMSLLVVGDVKSPNEYPLDGVRFVSFEEQLGLGFEIARCLPKNHYARKNIGYLIAARQRSALIYDTDDDNAPLPGWRCRGRRARAGVVVKQGWANVYGHFTEERIWPRGFPLEHVRDGAGCECRRDELTLPAPIQQGLANGSPDVDAVWRMVMDREFTFGESGSLSLAPGVWCPFNSQSTWWFPEAYPLLYLPSHVSFRMTDIWRSFVAQRCLWEMGYGVVFHGAEMYQERNPHSLLKDFELEVPGYLGNTRLCALLEATPLRSGPGTMGANLISCYAALVGGGFVPKEEMTILEAWLADLEPALKPNQPEPRLQ